MNALLPDTACSIVPSHSHTLDWVGMEQIRLPLRLGESEADTQVAATVDIGVDLPGGENARKGIHMSRLYRYLLRMTESPLTVQSLKQCLLSCIESHADCQSVKASMKVKFDLLLQRSALLSQNESGWQGYVIELNAQLIDHQFKVSASVDVTYSSTCPCSAALSRQALGAAFLESFSHMTSADITEVKDWLLENGSLATPHSQRSIATVTVDLDPDSDELGIIGLIDRIEDALQTPVQTFVKRQDEQAFAIRNGSNLMYVEDASRRIIAALKDYPVGQVEVRHFESLHGHDAVAKSSWRDGADL